MHPIIFENVIENKLNIDEFQNLDLTAEFLLSIQDTNSSFELLYTSLGNKKRSYRKDINLFKKSKGERFTKIDIEVNRQGIYDYLPEGLFHQPFNPKSGEASSTNNIEEIKRQRQNEKLARTFFLPIENEIFAQRIAITKLENDLFLNNSESRNKYIDLIKHWRLSNIFNNYQIVEIIRFFPLLHFYRNNIKYIETCLIKMLKYNVRIDKQINYSHTITDERLSWSLLESCLGVETILGNTIQIKKNKYIISIGEIKRIDFKKFLPNTNSIEVIMWLINLFFSADSIIEINIFANIQDSKFYLSKDADETFLGYNTYL
jgi:type VI secretion system protein ImpH